MKTVILAAGQGKRLKPLTAKRPKVMLPLANTSILEHILINAKSAGIKDFIFVVSYYKEVIIDYFQSGEKWNVNIEYITQSKPLGTEIELKIDSLYYLEILLLVLKISEKCLRQIRLL